MTCLHCMSTDCIFCNIARKEIPTTMITETDEIMVFKDIHPSAPIHLLVVPKRHIASVNELEERDKDLVGEMLLVAKEVAKSQGLDARGYKLVFNVGRGGGQVIDHLHLHLLGGWGREENPDTYRV